MSNQKNHKITTTKSGNIYKFSLDDVKTYESIRRSGKYNMFMDGKLVSEKYEIDFYTAYVDIINACLHGEYDELLAMCKEKDEK